MRRKRRALSPFSLSFLDSMSCGLGAVVLLFLIIRHNVEANTPTLQAISSQPSETTLLDKDIEDGKKQLAELRNTIAEVDQQNVIAEGLARRIMQQIQETQGDMKALHAQSAEDEIAALEAQIKDLQAKKTRLDAESKNTGEKTRTFQGQGTRLYLTGIKVEGQRILILLDASASMLDKTIVNIIRRKNMSDDRKANSEKWHQATGIVDWLTTRLPVASHYQIYLFNTAVKSALAGTEGKWLSVSDLAQLNQAVDVVKHAIPDGGTSLENAFTAAQALSPPPDSIYIITDGLPTQGSGPPLFASKVSGKERQKLFESAIKRLPGHAVINTVLLPMEGDPQAAHDFWGLAVATRGSFLAPASDWP